MPMFLHQNHSNHILHLTLFRKWFDKILSGEKREEYRCATTFWKKRLIERKYDEIHFRNGYQTDAPWMRAEFKDIGYKTGSPNGTYVITLGRVLEVKNLKPEQDAIWKSRKEKEESAETERLAQAAAIMVRFPVRK